MADKESLVVAENIETRILTIRGQKVMLDADLAELYGVETKRLNEQVRRNSERFPEDFMFQLTSEEFIHLRSQIATSNNPVGRGGRRYLPFVFTEHGAIMAASVLNSSRAVEVSVHVVRAFVHLRELVSSHKELAQKLNQLERKVGAHDKAIAEIITAIRELMTPPEPKKKRPIGFAPWKEK
ncbi:MAG: ORF6N domain-containing protein [Gallionellaceae bacterium]